MRFDLDKEFAIHGQGMLIRSKRAEILANNMANADTPNFKARDIDFKQMMREVQQNTESSRIKTTNPKHINIGSGFGDINSDLLYRNPLHASIDGNTVDSQMEKSQFVQNAIQYQTSLRFMSGKIKSLTTAIKGE